MQLESLPRVMNAFVPFLFLILKVAVPKVFWHSLIVAEEAKRNNINFISYTMWDVPNLDYFGMFLIRLPRVTLMFYVLSDCSSLHVYIYNYLYIFFIFMYIHWYACIQLYIYIYACVSVWVCWCVCVQHVIMYLYNLYNKYTHMYIFFKIIYIYSQNSWAKVFPRTFGYLFFCLT